jgi:hypothetical protein
VVPHLSAGGHLNNTGRCMPNKSTQPTEKKPTRPSEKARNEQRSPPRDSNSAAGDTEQQALADAVDDLDGRD